MICLTPVTINNRKVRTGNPPPPLTQGVHTLWPAVHQHIPSVAQRLRGDTTFSTPDTRPKGPNVRGASVGFAIFGGVQCEGEGVNGRSNNNGDTLSISLYPAALATVGPYPQPSEQRLHNHCTQNYETLPTALHQHCSVQPRQKHETDGSNPPAQWTCHRAQPSTLARNTRNLHQQDPRLQVGWLS